MPKQLDSDPDTSDRESIIAQHAELLPIGTCRHCGKPATIQAARWISAIHDYLPIGAVCVECALGARDRGDATVETHYRWANSRDMFGEPLPSGVAYYE